MGKKIIGMTSGLKEKDSTGHKAKGKQVKWLVSQLSHGKGKTVKKREREK